jgi:HEAT repeat protein
MALGQADGKRRTCLVIERLERERYVGSMDPRLLDADVQAEISETMDRSWCLALVEALADPALSSDQRRPLERTLADLDDPRFVEPLLVILNDHKRPNRVLDSAVNVLSECGVLASWSKGAIEQPDVASRWIRSDNTHLQRLGFSLGNRADRQAIDEYISEVFDPPELGESDRITRMRACLPAAVASMAFGFEEPEYQARKVSLLDHGDPEVRAAAVRTLLWDEPNFAEYPLIAATRDADPDVVIDALDVLRYYPTLAVRRVLVTATSEAATLQQRQMADQSLASIDEDLLRELNGLVDHPDLLPATKAWFGEARRVLSVGVSLDLDATTSGNSGELGKSGKSGKSQPDSLALDAAVALSQPNTTKPGTEWNQALVESLRDPDGSWVPKLRWLENLQPDQIPSTDVATFCAAIAHHDDPNVRYRGTRILAGCDCADLLLDLLGDPVGGVRKSASYALHDVSPSQLVAHDVLAPVLSGELGGTRASESVRTWARHAFALDAEAAGAQALALAEDRRESVRHAAIKQIVAFGAPGGKSLVKFLRSDPLVTWAVHSTIITSRHLLGISDRLALSALDQFLDADNLWLQLALATFRA